MRWHLNPLASRLFSQPFVQVQIKENIQAPCHWPLWGNTPVTDEFPAQRASNAENVSIWWCHHENSGLPVLLLPVQPSTCWHYQTLAQVIDSVHHVICMVTSLTMYDTNIWYASTCPFTVIKLIEYHECPYSLDHAIRSKSCFKTWNYFVKIAVVWKKKKIFRNPHFCCACSAIAHGLLTISFIGCVTRIMPIVFLLWFGTGLFYPYHSG